MPLIRLNPGISYQLTAGDYTIDPSSPPYHSGKIESVGGVVNFVGTQRLYLRRDNGPENIVLKGLRFDGPLVYSDQAGGGICENITIDDCEFHNASRFEFRSGLKNSLIQDCLWRNVNQGIYGEYYDGLTVQYCDFFGGHQQAHIDAIQPSRNLVWRQNYAEGWSRIGLECQSTADGVLIEDCKWDLPVGGPPHLATISGILDNSRNVRITRCWFPHSPTNVWHVEAGGGNNQADATIIDDCYLQHALNLVKVTDKKGTWYVIVKNNRTVGPITISADNGQGVLVNQNNGPNVPLTWDINRERPGRHRRLGSAPVDPCAPIKAENAQLKQANAELTQQLSVANAKIAKAQPHADAVVEALK